MIKIGIQYYYCCQESEYDVFMLDVSENFISDIDKIYDGAMTEINFISKRFSFLIEEMLQNEKQIDLCNLDGYMDCDYQFIYIICE